ncbi:MAG: hypothetical protein R3F31_16095 [Verrucomicrobiales bacterium]
MFGTGHDARTLLSKVAVDQFIMSPLWFVPTVLIALRWVDLGGSWARTRASLDRVFWTRTCPTALVTNWLVWIPTLSLVYSLPSALQFPFFRRDVLLHSHRDAFGPTGPDQGGTSGC